MLVWNTPPRRAPTEPIRILAYDAAANTTTTLSLSVIVCGCTEGGSCVQVTTPNFDVNNYYQEQCMCSVAYEGDFCEEDVDGCRQNPCQDPSLCEDSPAPAVGFVCTGCLEGYTLNGTLCEGMRVHVCSYVVCVCVRMCATVLISMTAYQMYFHETTCHNVRCYIHGIALSYAFCISFIYVCSLL